MTKNLSVLPNPAVKPKVTNCALLEGHMEEWIVCCTQRFCPLARRIAKDDSLAEDALQISWIKVLQSINRAYFNGPVACSWVAKIVANTAKNIDRQRYQHAEIPLVEIEAPVRSPEDLALEKQRLVLLREMISLLPETYRQVIDLRIYKGFSTQQTANLLYISPSNVSTRLNRAVRLLRKRVNARIQSASRRSRGSLR